MFPYTVLVGFADAVNVSEDSIQEHSWPQIVGCHFLIFFSIVVDFLKLHSNVDAKCIVAGITH